MQVGSGAQAAPVAQSGKTEVAWYSPTLGHVAGWGGTGVLIFLVWLFRKRLVNKITPGESISVKVRPFVRVATFVVIPVICAWVTSIFYSDNKYLAMNFLFIVLLVSAIFNIEIINSDELYAESVIKLKAEKRAAELQYSMRTKLDERFARFPSLEHNHLKDVMRGMQSLSDPLGCRSCLSYLDPGRNIRNTIAIVHEYVKTVLANSGRLRVALFVPENGKLVCRESFDGSEWDCIKSPEGRHRDRFDLSRPQNGGRNSLCVELSLGRIEQCFSSNAEKDHSNLDHPFEFFDPTQRERIKSYAGFLAFPHGANDLDPSPVMMCDTDQIGFFDESDSLLVEMMKMLMFYVRQRVFYELDLEKFLDSVRRRNREAALRVSSQAVGEPGGTA